MRTHRPCQASARTVRVPVLSKVNCFLLLFLFIMSRLTPADEFLALMLTAERALAR